MKKLNQVIKPEEYQDIQIKRSEDKWDSTTFDEKLFLKILLTALPQMVLKTTGKTLRPEKIACLGIRNGNEYLSLRKVRSSLSELAEAEVYGVDINPAVKGVGENCLCSDFAHLPKDWEGKFDLVYSNSLDHAFDVLEALAEWRRILGHDRFLLVELSKSDKVTPSDIYAFTESDVNDLFLDGFEVMKVWQEYGQSKSFNVLARIIK